MPNEAENWLQLTTHAEASADGSARSEALPITRVQTQPGEAVAAGAPSLSFLAPAAGPDELGRLAQYRVLRTLGHGGMGIVFHAEDLVLHRPVALKVMQPEVAATDHARDRFLREARALAGVRHDHIVTIYQVGEDRGVPFLAMELLLGESLAARLQSGSRLTLGTVCRIGKEIALGLAAAHRQGIVHRDIKPANIWLEAPRDRVKLLDFGLAVSHQIDHRLTSAGTVVGTPAFMAPEQGSGHPPDGRADLYSLGAVLYYMLTAQLPFDGPDLMTILMKIANGKVVPLIERRPEVPPALATLVHGLMHVQPAARPASALDVADELHRLEVQYGSGTLPLTVANLPLPKPSRSRHVGAVAAACVGLLGLAAGWWFWPAHESKVSSSAAVPSVPSLARTDDALPPAPLNPPASEVHPVPGGVWERIGTFQHPALRAVSAIVRSQRHPGIFYVVNDSSSGAAELLAIDLTGRLRARFAIDQVRNFDWEGMTTDFAGHLFIGDIGQRAATPDRPRTTLRLYKIAEPESLPTRMAESEPPRVLPLLSDATLRFPDGPQDCDTLMFWAGDLFLISKDRRRPTMYRVPRHAAGERVTLEDLGPPPGRLGQIKDVAITPDGRQLAACGSGIVAVAELPPTGKVDDLRKIEFRVFHHPDPSADFEGVVWDGPDLIIVGDKPPIFRFRFVP